VRGACCKAGSYRDVLFLNIFQAKYVGMMEFV
jgi:hypothetical protein